MTGGGVKGATNEVEPKSSFVNINTATQKELETLPGIGEKTAEKIIDYRDKNGKFTTIKDIMKVKGIGEGKFEKMKEMMSVK